MMSAGREARMTAAVDRNQLRGHRQQIAKSAALTVGALCSPSRSAAALRHRKDQRKLAVLLILAALTRARIIGKQGDC